MYLFSLSFYTTLLRCNLYAMKFTHYNTKGHLISCLLFNKTTVFCEGTRKVLRRYLNLKNGIWTTFYKCVALWLFTEYDTNLDNIGPLLKRKKIHHCKQHKNLTLYKVPKQCLPTFHPVLQPINIFCIPVLITFRPECTIYFPFSITWLKLFLHS